jgi:hypothetical protein
MTQSPRDRRPPAALERRAPRVGFSQSHWTGTVYCTNLTNNLGIVAYQDPILFGNRNLAVVSQPRTIGFTVAYSFKEH